MTNSPEAGTRDPAPDAGIKPGIKTSELYVTLALMVLGTILLLNGQEQLGVALLGAAGVTYTASRGLAKVKK